MLSLTPYCRSTRLKQLTYENSLIAISCMRALFSIFATKYVKLSKSFQEFS